MGHMYTYDQWKRGFALHSSSVLEITDGGHGQLNHHYRCSCKVPIVLTLCSERVILVFSSFEMNKQSPHHFSYTSRFDSRDKYRIHSVPVFKYLD